MCSLDVALASILSGENLLTTRDSTFHLLDPEVLGCDMPHEVRLLEGTLGAAIPTAADALARLHHVHAVVIEEVLSDPSSRHRSVKGLVTIPKPARMAAACGGKEHAPPVFDLLVILISIRRWSLRYTAAAYVQGAEVTFEMYRWC